MFFFRGWQGSWVCAVPEITPLTLCAFCGTQAVYAVSKFIVPLYWAFCGFPPAHQAFCNSQGPLCYFQIHFPPPRQSSALHPPNRLFVNLGTIYMLIHFNYNSLHLLTLNSLLPPTLATTSLSFMWRLNSWSMYVQTLLLWGTKQRQLTENFLVFWIAYQNFPSVPSSLHEAPVPASFALELLPSKVENAIANVTAHN